MDIGGEVIGQLPAMRAPLKRLKNGMVVQWVDWRDDPAHDEAWAASMGLKHGGIKSTWWLQNYEGVLTRGGDPVWPYLSREVHIKPMPPTVRNDSDWTLYRSLDQGFRHPECCAWAAVNKHGDCWFYRQYYATGKPVGLNAKAILELTPPGEQIRNTAADPSVWKHDPVTGQVMADVYLAAGLSIVPANNNETTYERLSAGFLSALARVAIFRDDLKMVEEALKTPGVTLGDVRRLAMEPAIWFDPSCAQGEISLYEQCSNFRWLKQTGDATQRAAPEKYQDVADEGVDVVRYLSSTPGFCWLPPAQADTTSLIERVLQRNRKSQESVRLDTKG